MLYERLVNPVAIVDGIESQLGGYLIHYPFSHGIAHWYARHNSYSTMEAQDLMREVVTKANWLGLITTDKIKRRKIIKQLLYKLPFRPLIILFYLLLFRGAFLDGVPGIYYSFMRASYELMIDLKAIELQRINQGQAL
jgi:hypothetical protein